MRESCLVLAISLSLLTGCAVSPQSIPESISPEIMQRYRTVCGEAGGDGVRIRVGGLRLLPDGALVDLIITARLSPRPDGSGRLEASAKPGAWIVNPIDSWRSRTRRAST